MRFFTKRKWFFATLCLLAVFCFVFVQKERSRKNDGFSIEKIHSKLGSRPEWELPSLSQEHKNVLNQHYYYLGRGLQFYAFESADKQYVLKFMRHQRLEPRPFFEWFCIVWPFSILRDNERAQCFKRVGYMCHSLKVAMLYAPHETGLVFVHLNKSSNEYGKVQIFDKMGTAYDVNLDETEFVLQKKQSSLSQQFLLSWSQLVTF